MLEGVDEALFVLLEEGSWGEPFFGDDLSVVVFVGAPP